MAMMWSNLVCGNTKLHPGAVYIQAAGQPIAERMLEVRIQASRSRFRTRQVENRPDDFGCLFPLSHLFSCQLRQVQVRHMLSHVSHPYHHAVEFWSPQISSIALRAAGAAVLEGYSGFLMDVGISIRMVDRYPWSVFEGGAELVDETFILSPDGDSGEAEPVNEILMISLEESVSGRGEFGGVPASKYSVNALVTRSLEGCKSASACVICLEDLEAGVEVATMPCCIMSSMAHLPQQVVGAEPPLPFVPHWNLQQLHS